MLAMSSSSQPDFLHSQILRCVQAEAIGLVPPAEAGHEPLLTGGAVAPAAVGAGEIAPDDVHHGAAPLGAAAAHRCAQSSDCACAVYGLQSHTQHGEPELTAGRAGRALRSVTESSELSCSTLSGVWLHV